MNQLLLTLTLFICGWSCNSLAQLSDAAEAAASLAQSYYKDARETREKADQMEKSGDKAGASAEREKADIRGRLGNKMTKDAFNEGVPGS